MQNKYLYIGSVVLVFVVLVFSILKKKGPLKPGITSPEQKKGYAEQYKSQLDAIFTRASRERRKLLAAEEVQVNQLQEKLIQLGYIYELPGNYYNSDHIFTPASMRLQAYLN